VWKRKNERGSANAYLNLVQPKSEASNRASPSNKLHPYIIPFNQLQRIIKRRRKHQLDILIFFQVCNFRMIDGVWKVLVIVLFATASPLILVALYQQTFRYLRRKRERELERIWRMTHDEAEEEGAVAQ
jgi:hypothetical protein